MAPENQWIEDSFPFGKVTFSGAMLSFRGVTGIKQFKHITLKPRKVYQFVQWHWIKWHVISLFIQDPSKAFTRSSKTLHHRSDDLKAQKKTHGKGTNSFFNTYSNVVKLSKLKSHSNSPLSETKNMPIVSANRATAAKYFCKFCNISGCLPRARELHDVKKSSASLLATIRCKKFQASKMKTDGHV